MTVSTRSVSALLQCRRLQPAIPICLLLFLLHACSSDSGTYNHCVKDSDCLPVAVCIDGKCSTECTANNQCPLGTHCLVYRCVPVEPPPADAADVPEAVDTVADLPAEIPREVPRDEPDAAPPDAGPTDLGPPDSGEPDALPPGCDPGNGPYAAACSCEQECESGLCIVNKIINAGTCTQYCANDAQCPGPDVCVPVDAVAVCLPNDSGQPTSCDPDQAICYKQLFLQNKLGKCACTAPCTTKADCPEGFACHVMGTQKGCVSVGEVCATGYIPCFGVCAGNPAQGSGFCTAICVSAADCPTAWSCTPIPDGVSVCSPQ